MSCRKSCAGGNSAFEAAWIDDAAKQRADIAAGDARPRTTRGCPAHDGAADDWPVSGSEIQLLVAASIAPAFRVSNYIEALFWCSVACVVFVRSRRLSMPARVDGTWWAIDLIVFGLSDLIEAQTGAWWRPAWLLAWKAACLLGMLVLAVRWFARR